MSASTSASSGERATLETRHRGLLMLAVMGVTIIQFLDMTIANVALPHMQSSLGASLDTIPWVLTSFIIAGVMVTPIVGWVSDRFGSRNVFLAAVAAFVLSSMLCGAATSLAQMILFRSIQGISAAFITPMSQTIMFDINPPSKQPGAVALWGMVSMVAPISGPILGGLLCDTLNWRWVFFINLPIGIPTLLVLFWLLPSRPIDSRRLDTTGFITLAVALVALQLMLDRGQHQDWFQSPEIIVELMVALGAFWIFMVHTLTTKNALFPAELFRNGLFVAAFFFMFILGMANVAVVSVMPLMYVNLFGYGPLDSGLLLIPRGIGVLLTMTVATKLMHRVDVRFVVASGFLIVAAALWMMSRWTLDMGREPIWIANFIQGLGLGLTFMPMNVAAFSAIDPRFRPDGSSLLNLMRNVGGSFGISAIVTLVSRNTQTAHSDIASHITATSLPGADPAGLTERLGDAGQALLQLVDMEINRQALMIAYIDIFALLSAVVTVVALVMLLMKPIRMGS